MKLRKSTNGRDVMTLARDFAREFPIDVEAEAIVEEMFKTLAPERVFYVAMHLVRIAGQRIEASRGTS